MNSNENHCKHLLREAMSKSIPVDIDK